VAVAHPPSSAPLPLPLARAAPQGAGGALIAHPAAAGEGRPGACGDSGRGRCASLSKAMRSGISVRARDGCIRLCCEAAAWLRCLGSAEARVCA